MRCSATNAIADIRLRSSRIWSGPPPPLLRACVAGVKPGTRALIAIPAPEHRAAYASLGFFPTRTTLHFMGRALAGELETDRRAWRFTLGDTDFF